MLHKDTVIRSTLVEGKWAAWRYGTRNDDAAVRPNRLVFRKGEGGRPRHGSRLRQARLARSAVVAAHEVGYFDAQASSETNAF